MRNEWWVFLAASGCAVSAGAQTPAGVPAAPPAALLLQSGEPAAVAQPGDTQYAAATALLTQKKYAEAAAALEKFVAEFPRHPRVPQARLDLGYSHLGGGKLDPAAKVFEALLAEKPAPEIRAGALVGLGKVHLDQRAYTKAVEVLSQAASGTPEVPGLTEYDEKNGPLANLYLGEALWALDRPAEAAKAFFRTTRWPSHPDAPRAQLRMAEAHRKAGNLAETALTYRTFADRYWRHPQAPQASLLAAGAFLEERKYPEAEREYRRVLMDYIESPVAPRAQMGIGQLAYLQAQYAVARAAYEAAALVFPRSGIGPEAELRVADCFLAEKNVEEAVKRYQQLGEGKDRRIAGEARYSLGRFYRERDELTPAAEAFKSVLEDRDAGEWRCLAGLRLAEIRQSGGDLPAAVAVLKTVLTLEPTPALRDETQFTLGQVLLKAKDLPGAEAQFKELRARQPAGPYTAAAGAAVAECRLAAKDAPAASAQCLELLKTELQPDLRATVLTTLGKAQLLQKQEAAAVGVLREVLDRHPSSPSAREAALALLDHYVATKQGNLASDIEKLLAVRYGMAGAPAANLLDEAGKHLRAGRYPEATRGFEQVLIQRPDRTTRLQARAGLAEALAAARKAREAMAQLEEIRQDAPPTGFLPGAQYRVATVLHQAGLSAEALPVYRAVLASQPDEGVASGSLLAIGRILGEAGEAAESERAYQEIVDRYPNAAALPNALYALAWCRIDAGRREEALPLFYRLASRHPEHPLAADALFRLAESDRAAGNAKVAADRYARAAASKSAIGDKAGYRLGWLRLQEKDHKGAAAAFQAVIEGFPQSELLLECRVRAGEALLQLEQDQQAAAQFEAVLAHKATTDAERRLQRQARVGRALAFLMQGEFDQARELARSEALPDNGWYGGRAQIICAEAVFLKSGPKAALVEYSRCASLFSRYRDVTAEALFRSGECHEKLGNLKQGRAVWQRVSDLYPDTEWAGRCREKLEATAAPPPAKAR